MLSDFLSYETNVVMVHGYMYITSHYHQLILFNIYLIISPSSYSSSSSSSQVRFPPTPNAPVIVSAGWDKIVKVWSTTNCRLRTNLVGHTGYLNTVTVSPDGSLCASGNIWCSNWCSSSSSSSSSSSRGCSLLQGRGRCMYW